ncbi:hypothetical protein WMF26_20455 [Sorangium sp. So ce185]|uniref:hypothetical protein n=1 Tax=Sorangium sp. So ce185 TaxID=3133287 RepID=UPI003F64396C
MSGYLSRLVQHTRGERAVVRPFTPAITAPDPGAEAWDDRTAHAAVADPAGRATDEATGAPSALPLHPAARGPAPRAAAAAAPGARSFEEPTALAAPVDAVGRASDGAERAEEAMPPGPRAPASGLLGSGALPPASAAPAAIEPAAPGGRATDEAPAGREPAAAPLAKPAPRGDRLAAPPPAEGRAAPPPGEGRLAPQREPRAAGQALADIAVEAPPPGATGEPGAGTWSSVAPIDAEALLDRRPAARRTRAGRAWSADGRPLARPAPWAGERGPDGERATPGARTGDGEAPGAHGRPSPPPGPPAAEASGAGPTVEVSIGRIEVRVAPAPRAAPRSAAAPPRPVVDLGEYLRRREQG